VPDILHHSPYSTVQQETHKRSKRAMVAQCWLHVAVNSCMLRTESAPTAPHDTCSNVHGSKVHRLRQLVQGRSVSVFHMPPRSVPGRELLSTGVAPCMKSAGRGRRQVREEGWVGQQRPRLQGVERAAPWVYSTTGSQEMRSQRRGGSRCPSSGAAPPAGSPLGTPLLSLKMSSRRGMPLKPIRWYQN